MMNHGYRLGLTSDRRRRLSLVTSGRNKFYSVFLFCAAGFLDKNNDLLFRNLKEVTFTRPLPLLGSLEVCRAQSHVFVFAGDVHV